MHVPNLHTAPKRLLIKIRTFLKKIDSYLEKYEFARCFEKANKFLNRQLKIAFKHPNFVRKLF